MTTHIDSTAARAQVGTGRRGVVPVVDVAGVSWPLYKVQALLAAVLLGVAAFLVTGSGQITMWVSALSLATVWWVQRARTAGSSS